MIIFPRMYVPHGEGLASLLFIIGHSLCFVLQVSEYYYNGFYSSPIMSLLSMVIFLINKPNASGRGPFENTMNNSVRIPERVCLGTDKCV